MYYLRFTKTTSTANSFDHFTGEDFKGVCCYELDCIEDELYLAIRAVAEKDNTYVKVNEGQFIVFEGSKISDNPYGYGVIATINTIIETGRVEWNEEARTYRII